jgi:hypothetical protein
MAFGLRLAVCGKGKMACGTWCAVYGVLQEIDGMRLAACDMRQGKNGLRLEAYGMRPLFFNTEYRAPHASRPTPYVTHRTPLKKRATLRQLCIFIKVEDQLNGLSPNGLLNGSSAPLLPPVLGGGLSGGLTI